MTALSTIVRDYKLKYTFGHFECEGKVEVYVVDGLEIHALYVQQAGPQCVGQFTVDTRDKSDEGTTVFFQGGKTQNIGTGNLLAGVLGFVRQKLKI